MSNHPPRPRPELAPDPDPTPEELLAERGRLIAEYRNALLELVFACTRGDTALDRTYADTVGTAVAKAREVLEK